MDNDKRSLILPICFANIHARFSRQIEKIESDPRTKGLRVIFIGITFASCAYLIGDPSNDSYALYKGRYSLYMYGGDSRADPGEDSVFISNRIARRIWSNLRTTLYQAEDPVCRRRDPLLVVQRPEEGPLADACSALIEQYLKDQQPGCKEIISSYLTETLYSYCLKNIDTLDHTTIVKLKRVIETKETALGVQNVFSTLASSYFMDKGGLDVFSTNIEDFVISYCKHSKRNSRERGRVEDKDFIKEEIWLRKDIAYANLLENREREANHKALRIYEQYIDSSYLSLGDPRDPMIEYTREIISEDNRGNAPGMLAFLMASGISFMRSDRSKYIVFASGKAPIPMSQILSRQRRNFTDACYPRLTDLYSSHMFKRRLSERSMDDRRFVKVPERGRSSPYDEPERHYYNSNNNDYNRRPSREGERRPRNEVRNTREEKEEQKRYPDEEQRTIEEQRRSKGREDENITVVVTVDDSVPMREDEADDEEILDYGDAWWVENSTTAPTRPSGDSKRKREEDDTEEDIETKRRKLEQMLQEEHKEEFKEIGEIAAKVIEEIVQEPDREKAQDKIDNAVKEMTEKFEDIANEDSVIREMLEADAWLALMATDVDEALLT